MLLRNTYEYVALASALKRTIFPLVVVGCRFRFSGIDVPSTSIRCKVVQVREDGVRRED